MGRIIPEPKYNKYSKLMLEVNDLFISIKVSKMDQNDEKVAKVASHHPIPSNEELDALHRRINEMFSEFEEPLRKKY